VAFFHKRSRTLLVTDSVLSVPEDPPAIVQLEPYPIVSRKGRCVRSSRTTRQAAARDGSASRCLPLLRPSALEMIELALRDALKAPDRSRQAYFGLFPFRWKDNWKQSFDALRGVDVCLWHQFCRRSFLTRHRGKPLIGRTRWRTGISSGLLPATLTRPSRQVASVSAGVRLPGSSP